MTYDYQFYLASIGFILAFIDFTAPSVADKIENAIDSLGKGSWKAVKRSVNHLGIKIFQPIIISLFIIYVMEIDVILGYELALKDLNGFNVESILSVLYLFAVFSIGMQLVAVVYIILLLSLSALIGVLNKNTQNKALATIGLIMAGIGFIPYLQGVP